MTIIIIIITINESHLEEVAVDQGIGGGAGRVVVESCTRKQHVKHTHTRCTWNDTTRERVAITYKNDDHTHSCTLSREKKKEQFVRRQCMYSPRLLIIAMVHLYSLDTRTIGRTEWKVKRSRCFFLFLFSFFGFFLTCFFSSFFLLSTSLLLFLFVLGKKKERKKTLDSLRVRGRKNGGGPARGSSRTPARKLLLIDLVFNEIPLPSGSGSVADLSFFARSKSGDFLSTFSSTFLSDLQIWQSDCLGTKCERKKQIWQSLKEQQNAVDRGLTHWFDSCRSIFQFFTKISRWRCRRILCLRNLFE